jgi:hypothetical protein
VPPGQTAQASSLQLQSSSRNCPGGQVAHDGAIEGARETDGASEGDADRLGVSDGAIDKLGISLGSPDAITATG